jgi:hypothetical protein
MRRIVHEFKLAASDLCSLIYLVGLAIQAICGNFEHFRSLVNRFPLCLSFNDANPSQLGCLDANL